MVIITEVNRDANMKKKATKTNKTSRKTKAVPLSQKGKNMKNADKLANAEQTADKQLPDDPENTDTENHDGGKIEEKERHNVDCGNSNHGREKKDNDNRQDKQDIRSRQDRKGRRYSRSSSDGERSRDRRDVHNSLSCQGRRTSSDRLDRRNRSSSREMPFCDRGGCPESNSREVRDKQQKYHLRDRRDSRERHESRGRRDSIDRQESRGRRYSRDRQESRGREKSRCCHARSCCRDRGDIYQDNRVDRHERDRRRYKDERSYQGDRGHRPYDDNRRYIGNEDRSWSRSNLFGRRYDDRRQNDGKDVYKNNIQRNQPSYPAMPWKESDAKVDAAEETAKNLEKKVGQVGKTVKTMYEMMKYYSGAGVLHTIPAATPQVPPAMLQPVPTYSPPAAPYFNYYRQQNVPPARQYNTVDNTAFPGSLFASQFGRQAPPFHSVPPTFPPVPPTCPPLPPTCPPVPSVTPHDIMQLMQHFS